MMRRYYVYEQGFNSFSQYGALTGFVVDPTKPYLFEADVGYGVPPYKPDAQWRFCLDVYDGGIH